MKPLVLSYTLLRDFENCPRKAHHLHVLKDLPKETASPEMAAGIAIHAAMEQAIKTGDASALGGYNHQMVMPLLQVRDQFGPQAVQAEAMLGITRAGAATGFFAADVWLRGKLDVVVGAAQPQAALLDWKTGKRREDPAELRVQAVLLRAAHPALQRIEGAYVWLRDGKVGDRYDLSDTAASLRDIRATAEAIESPAQTWEPKPNPLCGWCRVASCSFNPRGGK